MVCKQPDCLNECPPSVGRGRPRVFCSDECRLRYWNTERPGRVGSPAHKISEYDAETKRGTCALCGPVTVYAVNDKYADGRPRIRLACSRRVKSHAYVTNRRYGRSRKRHGRRYGLTIEQFDQLVLDQLGRCAICDRELRALQVDHCHDAGAVRGLLCVTCNTGLGKLGDSLERVCAVLAYLERAVVH